MRANLPAGKENMKDKISKELQGLFDELDKNAYNRDYHTYYYKDANQIIRKHFERLEKQVKVEPVVKQAVCGKWQRKKPDKPCYFLHRYNKKDRYPSLFEAYIDTEVLCVANIQDDEFVEIMEGFANGQFYIIEK